MATTVYEMKNCIASKLPCFLGDFRVAYGKTFLTLIGSSSTLAR